MERTRVKSKKVTSGLGVCVCQLFMCSPLFSAQVPPALVPGMPQAFGSQEQRPSEFEIPLVQPPQQTAATPAFSFESSKPIDVTPQPPSNAGPETVDSVEKIGVQGNWVKKRDWLLKSHDVNNEIHDIVLHVEKVRKTYIDKNSQIDTELDTYYKHLGLGQGKIQELFDNIFRYLDKKRTKGIATLKVSDEVKDPELQAKIDIIEQSARTSKQQLEQLKLDMKSIEDLDRSLSDRIKRFDEQASMMQEEATKAQARTNELWSIIDHNKARLYYYELKNAILEKVKATQSYLAEDLLKDFDAVIETIKKQITITQDQIKKIESDGIFIKERARRVKEMKLKDLEAQKSSAVHSPAEQPKVPAVKLEAHWYDRVYAIGRWFVSIMARIKNALFGVTPTAVPKPAVVTQAQQLPAEASTSSVAPTAVPAMPVALPVPTPGFANAVMPPAQMPAQPTVPTDMGGMQGDMGMVQFSQQPGQQPVIP